jgi:glycerophosphoryl diester phosphodiesterase
MPKTICCAHRGAMAYAPQNTMKAFRLAAEIGADMIELDVHLTRDGVAVVNHDTSFKRAEVSMGTRSENDVSAGTRSKNDHVPSGIIREMTAAEIRNVRFQGEPIPELEEVIQFCKESGTRINIEIKAPEAAAEVVRLVNKHDMRPRIMVSSFSSRALKAVKASDKSFETAYLTTPAHGPFAIPFARRLGCAAVNPHKMQIGPLFVASAHRNGLKIFAWTVNDERTMRRFISLGVDGIITNKPDLLLRLR